MNDLDLIDDNEEKKRNTALNLIDDCIFFWLKFMHLFVAHFIILYGKYYQKNEASFELIFQNCFINIEQYSGIFYHYD